MWVGTWKCRERFRSFLFSSTLTLREARKQIQALMCMCESLRAP